MNVHKFLNKKYPVLLLFFLVLGSFFEAEGEEIDSLLTEMPKTWQYSSGYSQEFPSEDKWWRIFKDPLLDSLINEGENNNFNLREAARRIEMARNSVRQAKSNYYPTLTTDIGWLASRTSGKTVKGSSPVSTSYFSFGVDMSWEIDVFGKVRESVREEKALLSVSRADYAAVSISLCAEIAADYVMLRTLQEELKVTRQHIVSQEEVLRITEARFEVGLASMLDVSQAKTDYYSTLATISNIETQIATTINAIAVLVGVYPGEIAPRLSQPGEQPQFVYNISVGVPLDILRRRPDILEAEYTLASYAAAVGVAEKDFLPTLSLTGSVGTSSRDFTGWFSKDSYTYSVGPTLSWTIFEGFYRNAALASAREQFMAGIDAYNQTVLTAVQEVENAMITYQQALKYEKQIEEVLEYANLSFKLALDRYRQGLDAFINVTDAQMDVLTYSNELVEARGTALSALISLYKALGGGWDISELENQ